MIKLPFSDKWFVMQGGDTLNVNLHMSLRAQWYAIDFMKVGGPVGRSLNSGDGTQLENFYSWEARVTAPVSGRVIKIVDNFADNPIGTKDPDNPAGNYITIETQDKKYIFLAHLKLNSILVREDQLLEIGEPLGECGNSGNSDFPHIHMHMQDSPIFNEGAGLNIFFSDISVELNGKSFKQVTWPLIRGLFVSN